MLEAVRVSLLAMAASSALWVFYKSFEVEWPDRYWDGLSGADPLISRTSGRYAAFRLLPFFVAATVAGTAAARLDISRAWVVWLFAATYVGLGPVRKAVCAWRESPRRIGSAVHRFGTAIALVAVAGLYMGVAGRLDPYVPTLKDAVFAAFIAVFVFLLGKLGIVAFTIQAPTNDSLIRRAISEIEPALSRRLNEVDPGGVFLTVAVVEQLNRPPWVRRVERLVPATQTHGLMQVRSDKVVSDAESVELFIARHADFCGRDYWENKDRQRFFKQHNAGQEFNELANRLHSSVWLADGLIPD